jgi:hypothetical protein
MASPHNGLRASSTALRHWIVDLIVVVQEKNRQESRTFFMSIPQAAWRENGALAPAAPRRVPSAAHALHDLEQMVTGSGREMEDAANFERYSKEFNPMTGTGLIEVWMPVNDRTKET